MIYRDLDSITRPCVYESSPLPLSHQNEANAFSKGFSNQPYPLAVFDGRHHFFGTRLSPFHLALMPFRPWKNDNFDRICQKENISEITKQEILELNGQWSWAPPLNAYLRFPLGFLAFPSTSMWASGGPHPLSACFTYSRAEIDGRHKGYESQICPFTLLWCCFSWPQTSKIRQISQKVKLFDHQNGRSQSKTGKKLDPPTPCMPTFGCPSGTAKKKANMTKFWDTKLKTLLRLFSFFFAVSLGHPKVGM